MDKQDARSLSADAQEALRKRAVNAHLVDGMRQKEVAKALGVSAYIVSQWVKAFRADGEAGVVSRPKGPPAGTGSLLTPKQAKAVRSLIIDKCPEQLKLPFFLWTRDAVRELIKRQCGIEVS